MTETSAEILNNITDEVIKKEIDPIFNDAKSHQIRKYWDSIDEFIVDFEGKRNISKILIANNGIAALKCMRSIRKWSYATFKNSRAILFVCIATPEDIKANAEYIKMSDKLVLVPGGSNVNNYANVDLIVRIAEQYAVDAVWPGWGHASENSLLPESLSKKGVTFLGPSTLPMWALGDKIASTILAQTVDVPTLPWSGSDITVELPNKDSLNLSEVINDSIYEAACVRDESSCLAICKKLGFPLMIKASEGGGGKGIRRVDSENDVVNMYNQVVQEVPGSPIFIMQCLDDVRHVEVQILCDEYGNSISLYGRDCSVQRRNQKILEEAPVVIVPENIFLKMEEAAVRLAKLVGYSSAGTVEYLYDVKKQSFYFLELNPRLQVEHPCTEVITDINIPACQLEIAMGLPLHRIREIRRFYQKPIYEKDSIVFDAEKRKSPDCHVVAVRITSEDPDEGFKPIPGDVEEINFKSSRSVWGYFSVGSIGGIHEFADSQFGHCFSAAETREQARENMIIALKELSIRGGFRTTVEYLIKILESDSYGNNEINTKWLDEKIAQKDKPEKPNTLLGVVCTSLHIGMKYFDKNFQIYKKHLEKGQFLPPNSTTNCADVSLISENTKYSLKVVQMGQNTFKIICNNSINEFEVHRMSGGGLIVSFQEASYMTYCQEDASSYRTMIDNRTCRLYKEYDLSIIRSPSSGKLIQFTVDDGQDVFQDQVVAIVEVMKLVLELRSPADGKVHHLVNQGSILEPSMALIKLDLKDSTKVNNWILFEDNLDQLVKEISLKNKRKDLLHDQKNRFSELQEKFVKSLNTCQSILDGYLLPDPYFNSWLNTKFETLIDCLTNPRLPSIEFEVTINELENRLPTSVVNKLKALNKTYYNQATSVLSKFPSQDIIDILKGHLNEIQSQNSPNRNNNSFSANVQNFFLNTQKLLMLASKYRNGLKGFAVHVISSLLLNYANVESHFNCAHYDRAIHKLLSFINESPAEPNIEQIQESFDYLSDTEIRHRIDPTLNRKAKPQTIEDVSQLILSHNQILQKNKIIDKFIHLLGLRTDVCPLNELVTSLRLLTELGKKEYSSIALGSRQLLIKIQTPTYEMRRNQVESMFLSAIRGEGQQILENLVTTETLLFDILNEFLYHPDELVVSAALEVYVRRAYIAYKMNSLEHGKFHNAVSYVKFGFFLPRPYTLFVDKSEAHSISKTSSFSRLSKPDQIRCSLVSQFERCGVMAAFKSLDSVELSINEILNCFENASINFEGQDGNTSNDHNSNKMRCIRSFSSINIEETDSKLLKKINDENQFRNILNIGLLQNENEDLSVHENKSTSKMFGHQRTFSNFTMISQCDENNVEILEKFLEKYSEEFKRVHISRVTFMIAKMRFFAKYYTFRAENNFKEDKVFRHLEPALAFQLEINRLKNYSLERIPVVNRRMNLYLGKAKVKDITTNKNSMNKDIYDYRFFVRSIIRHSNLLSNHSSFEYLQSEAERVLLESMDAMEAAFTHPFATSSTGNHIFMNFAPAMFLDEISELEETVRQVAQRYGQRLWRLKITQAELRFMIKFKNEDVGVPIRFFLNNEQGYNLDIDTYQEVANPETGVVYFQAFDKQRGDRDLKKRPHPFHGMEVDTPYKTKDYFQLKRSNAMKFNTPYAYDYPALFERALEDLWNEYNMIDKEEREEEKVIKTTPKKRFRKLTLQQIESTLLANEINRPKNEEFNPPQIRKEQMTEQAGFSLTGGYVKECTELALDNNASLIPVDRLPGTNDIGIVCWFMIIKTPDCPEGRSLILIANDVTINAGSFGPAEDLLFARASQLSRKLGIPRLYMASNTGARIKLAEEVKSCFKICWKNESMPEKGFKYIYLDKEDYKSLSVDQSVLCEPVIEEDGIERYKINAIIGRENDMSVENLRGSAMIASETSIAYEECFTMSIVSSRTIGIGAYLVRLGQRLVQVDNSHIILTGAMALNKLLGRNVYSSNSQLGGIQIMASNGIAHFVANNELKAIKVALNTMLYVSPRKGMRKIALYRTVPENISGRKQELFDPFDREISYLPTRDRPNDDPRWMMTGVYYADMIKPREDVELGCHKNAWLSGFFDYNSFQECLSGWANTVITGRARLGGIAIGVIVPESRSVICKVPADPANPNSEAVNVSQAGQVWYPDSSFKTAQAIQDFNMEELPLIIFANWRGFSGGLKDMYDQVLKFGALIVDALRKYTQPIFVYIPPHGEVRGGAWVVIDPSINPNFMEMYSDPTTSRASVLEPEGVVEIKFRQGDLVKTMMRNDSICQQIMKDVKEKKSLVSEIPKSTRKNFSKHKVEEEIKKLNVKLEQRIKLLTPFYEQVSRTFADLHDTPQRLEYRNLVHKLIPWKDSRRFFYLRLRNNLLINEAIKIMSKIFENTNYNQNLKSDVMPEFESSSQKIFCKSLSLTLDEDEKQIKLTNLVEQKLNLVDKSNKVENDLDNIAQATKVSEWTPQIAIRKSNRNIKIVTMIRDWFVEDVKTHEEYSKYNEDKLYSLWDHDEKIRGDWLSFNLNYQQLYYVPSKESGNKFVKSDSETFLFKKIRDKKKEAVIFQIKTIINANKNILPEKFLEML